jgi:hypothetical protein
MKMYDHVLEADVIIYGKATLWRRDLKRVAARGFPGTVKKMLIAAGSLTDEQVAAIIETKEEQDAVPAHDGQNRFSARPRETN